MRNLCLLVLAALIAIPTTAAQMDLDESHQVRVAYGDIPSTVLVEEEGVWNIQQTFLVPVGQSTNWTLPTGHFFTGAGCDECTSTVDSSQAPDYTLHCDSADSGTCALTVAHRAGGSTAFGTTLPVRDDGVVILYVPDGTGLVTSQDADFELPCTENKPCTISRYSIPSASAFWFSVTPTPIDPEVITTDPTDGEGFGLDFVTLMLGLIAGAGLWAFLVQRGVVQKRSRKQVASVSAHREAAKEPRPVLEARKKLLMAGLKELELAKQDQSVDTQTYDSLKAEWKKETVTVMRAIEEAGDA